MHPVIPRINIIPNIKVDPIGNNPNKVNGRKIIAVRKIYKRLRFHPNFSINYLHNTKKIRITSIKTIEAMRLDVVSNCRTVEI